MEYYIRETLITDFQDVKTLKNKRKCFSFFFELRLFFPLCLLIVYFFLFTTRENKHLSFVYKNYDTTNSVNPYNKIQ